MGETCQYHHKFFVNFVDEHKYLLIIIKSERPLYLSLINSFPPYACFNHVLKRKHNHRDTVKNLLRAHQGRATEELITITCYISSSNKGRSKV